MGKLLIAPIQFFLILQQGKLKIEQETLFFALMQDY